MFHDCGGGISFGTGTHSSVVEFLVLPAMCVCNDNDIGGTSSHNKEGRQRVKCGVCFFVEGIINKHRLTIELVAQKIEKENFDKLNASITIETI